MIEVQDLKAHGVAHGFFTRQGGHSKGIFASLNCGMGSGDDKATVTRNREVVAERLRISETALVTVYQMHSATVAVVTRPWDEGARPKADAMVSATPGLALGVLTADCGPILFADHAARVIGAAHAGWKGALAGVTGRTLEAMESLGARRSRVVAVLGPTISAKAYEVGPEFPARFIDVDPANRGYFTPAERPGHSMFDLPGYLAHRLRSEGAGQVIDLARCTFSDEDSFFSYRRSTHRSQRDYGRQISAIALLED
jgi:YfiH family protein